MNGLVFLAALPNPCLMGLRKEEYQAKFMTTLKKNMVMTSQFLLSREEELLVIFAINDKGIIAIHVNFQKSLCTGNKEGFHELR